MTYEYEPGERIDLFAATPGAEHWSNPPVDKVTPTGGSSSWADAAPAPGLPPVVASGPHGARWAGEPELSDQP